MIKFKAVKPFVFEFLTYLFLICCSFMCFVGDFAEKMPIAVIAVYIYILYETIESFNHICRGFKALSDYVFQKTKTDNYIFINEIKI